MTTDNPKVSGYVSQEICDRLKTFKEERKLKSISEALGIALAEYFQVDQKTVYQTSLLSGDNFVSIDRFETLEKKFSELSSSLPSELERMFSSLRNELLNGLPKAIEVETVNIESEPLSEPQDVLLSELASELPSEPVDESQNQGDSLCILPSELEEIANQPQLDFAESNFDSIENLTPESTSKQLASILAESPDKLSAKLLAKRLKVNSNLISTNKKTMEETEFYSWLKKKDPDKISWQPIGGSLNVYIKGWIPADNTPSELLSRLKEWLVANPK